MRYRPEASALSRKERCNEHFLTQPASAVAVIVRQSKSSSLERPHLIGTERRRCFPATIARSVYTIVDGTRELANLRQAEQVRYDGLSGRIFICVVWTQPIAPTFGFPIEQWRERSWLSRNCAFGIFIPLDVPFEGSSHAHFRA